MKREHILLRAAYQLLKQQENTIYTLNILETSTMWDSVECDGYCLKEEIEDLLLDNNISLDDTI